MGVGWSGVGPELLVTVDRDAGALGEQIQRQLREAIRSGRLTDGERLPSSRVLAEQLGVSRGLVVDCFAQLESEGYLTSRAGSGTCVASGVADAPSPRPLDDAPERFDVDFEYGVPDLNLFPTRDWAWALTRACREVSLVDLGDETGAGNERLCEVMASYVGRVRGSAATAADVVVCPGFRYGLNVVLRALAATGIDTVAFEDPGPVDHDAIAVRSGLGVVHVPVDEFGIDVAALAATDARAVVVTPAHQCPTGVLMSAERRQALISWARDIDGFIVEDDYDAEFRYDRQPVGSLQGLAPDRVIAMGSVSKTLAPAIRIGWTVAPSQLRDQLVREKQLLGRGVPTIDQLALAALVESGRFDRHLRNMRAVYRSRCRALLDAVADVAPLVEVTGINAGCHALLNLPAGSDEAGVVAAARQQSVGVAGLGRYCTNAKRPPALVVGFGNVTESAIARGITIVAGLLP